MEINRIVFRILALAILIVFLGGVYYLLHNGLEIGKRDGNILRFPMLYRGLPALGVAVFVLMYLITLIIQPEKWQEGLIVILIISVPCSIVFTVFSLWRVEVGKEEFLYRNFIGIKKQYRYEDIYLDGLVFRLRANGKKVFKMPDIIPNRGQLTRCYTKYRLKNGRNKE